MLKPFIAASCLCAATLAGADPSRLSGGEIGKLIAGATIEIDTPLGTKLPVRYARDGQLSGQARDLAPYLGAATDTGQWWVTADRLCHRWKRWLNSEPQCFRLRKVGRTIYWQSQDGNSGTALITVPAPVQTAAAPPPTQAATPPPPAQPEAAKPVATVLAAPVHPSEAPADGPALPGQRSVPAPKEAAVGSSWIGAAAQAPTSPAGRPPRAQPEPKRAAQLAFMVVNVARNDVLNVRSGPSAEFAVVGGLRPGSRGVTITGSCLSKWCPVEHLAANGWVNATYLAREEASPSASAGSASRGGPLPQSPPPALRDGADAPRACLTPAARALLERIEERFGPVQVVSTCRPGAMIAGTGWASRHASGNAVDFKAGSRKAEIVEWLIANHRGGGTMTHADMDHIHVDIGRHFVSIAGGPHWRTWSGNRRGQGRSSGG